MQTKSTRHRVRVTGQVCSAVAGVMRSELVRNAYRLGSTRDLLGICLAVLKPPHVRRKALRRKGFGRRRTFAWDLLPRIEGTTLMAR